jgi:trehalose 6-phosphate phosphatase
MVSSKYFFDKSPLEINGDNRIILLMCDFDGTLAPIQGDPGKCILLPDIRKQLEMIVHTGNSHVAILSGRSLSDIQRKVPIKDIYHAGSHGLEISGPQIRYVHPGAVAAKDIIDKVRRKLKEEIGNIEGILIEKKKFSFTLHYRMANRADGAFVRKTFYKIISENPEKQNLAILKGKKVLELMPNVSWDKGNAAFLIIERLKKRCLPIYIGDDVADESAFEALSEGGITIRVGPSKKTAAQYYIRNQREILRFLHYVNEMVQYCDAMGSV